MKTSLLELSRIQKLSAVLALAAGAGAAGCGSSSGGDTTGGAGSSVAGSSPSGGTTATGSSGSTGTSAGTSATTAGSSSTSGSSSGGTAGAAAAGSSAVSGSNTGGTAGATAGAGGTTSGGGTSAGGGAAGSTSGGAGGGSNTGTNVLIYCVTTGFRHGSIPDAANGLVAAVQKLGLTSELVGCGNDMNKPDPTKLTTDALAKDAAVVMVANSGEPFGYPATTEIQNLVDYVQHGGALVAIEDADHCYDGGFNGHPASDPYVNLIGNDFVGHPGGVALATCTTMGTNPSVTTLPATFTTTDEIYQTTKFRPENQVVLSCKSSGDTAVRPVSYIRQEGSGRVFFTALGHNNESWTAPMDAAMANTKLIENHVLPGMLWAMGR